MKKIVATMLVICIFLTSSIAFASGSTASTPKYKGEDIFRGLFLGQGEVTKLFPNIWTKEMLTKVNNKESKALTDDIVSRINKIDPNYYAQLEKASYSNNQLQVKAALTRGQELIDNALKQIQANGSVVVKGSQPGTGQGQCVYLVVYAAALFAVAGAVTHAVVVTAGGAVAAYFVIYGAKYLWSADASDKDGSLKQDMFVNTVVKAFAN